MELIDYKLAEVEELPVSDVSKPDVYWGQLAKIKLPVGADQTLRFPLLSQLVKILLVIPHSNAASERMFSMLRNIDTTHRGDLDQETICALMACKVNSTSTCCYDATFDSELLKACKTATRDYNLEHASKNNK